MSTDKENTLLENEEQIKKDDERFEALKHKKEEELNADEKKELGEIKERYGQRTQKRIDKLTWERKVAEEKYGEMSQKVDELTAEIEKLKTERPLQQEVIPKKETIKVGDKVFYTDKTLSTMIRAKEITEEEAWAHQQERLEEVVADKAYQRIKKEDNEKEIMQIRKEDAASVLKEFPHFDAKNPNHNPDDPFYKLVNRIYKDGYFANPKGLSEAVKLAKELTAKNNVSVNREDLSLESSNNSQRRKEQEITLSEAEKDTARRFYCLGDIKNPKTGRPYTEEEALYKALEAKKKFGREQ